MESIIDKEITVHVRSPSLNETLEVKTTLNATILTLKKAIEPVHPHHPKSANQRIIYSGKLLKDTDILTDVLKKSDEEVTPTFHLVVKPSLDAATSSSRANTTTSHPSSFQASTSASSPSTFPSDRASQSTDFQMPQYQQQQQQQAMYPSSLPGGYQVVSINGQYYLAPTLVLSHNVPPQQFHNTQMPPPHAQHPVYQPPADANAFTSPHTPPQAQQQQQQHVQEPIVQPYINQLPQPQQNNPLFGGNGPALARPAIAQRATSIWLALKLIVVLFMLCQGASIERIFIFHAVAFVFFLYQTGRLRFVLRRVRVEDFNRFRPGGGGGGNGRGLQRPAAGTPPGNGNVHADNNAEGASTSVHRNSDNLTQRGQAQDEGSGSSQDNASGSSDTNGTAAQAPARPLTVLDVWKRGAYTFFASLWPTYGVDPQIAQALQNENNNNNDQ